LGISKGSGSRFEVRNERVDGGVAAAAVYSDRGLYPPAAAAVGPRD